MTYTIQATHPNEFKDNSWKNVDQFDHLGDLRDHLSFPVFEWYPGMMVRCLSAYNHYAGIFNEQHCIAVSYDSDAMSLNITKAEYKTIAHYKSYPIWWHECRVGSQLIYSMSLYMPKMYMLKLMCKYMRQILPFVLENKDDLLRGIERVENNEEVKLLDTYAFDDLFLASYKTNEYRTENAFTITLARTARRAATLLGQFRGTDSAMEEFELAIFIRQHVPFYDVALELVR